MVYGLRLRRGPHLRPQRDRLAAPQRRTTDPPHRHRRRLPRLQRPTRTSTTRGSNPRRPRARPQRQAAIGVTHRGLTVSRGLGSWQRFLLHELYHNPRPPTLGFDGPWISVRRFTATDSEYAAARRAARGLVSRGWAQPFAGWAHSLTQVVPPPDIACPQCGRKCSELCTSAPTRNTYHDGTSL